MYDEGLAVAIPSPRPQTHGLQQEAVYACWYSSPGCRSTSPSTVPHQQRAAKTSNAERFCIGLKLRGDQSQPLLYGLDLIGGLIDAPVGEIEVAKNDFH